MPIARSLKEEFRRLARKEAAAQVAALKKTSRLHEREIAALKRQLRKQEQAVATMPQRTATVSALSLPLAGGAPKFSAAKLRRHRKELALSAANYGALVCVIGRSIYNWEKGKSQPRPAQLRALAAVLAMGQHQALARLKAIARGKVRAKKA